MTPECQKIMDRVRENLGIIRAFTFFDYNFENDQELQIWIDNMSRIIKIAKELQADALAFAIRGTEQ